MLNLTQAEVADIIADESFRWITVSFPYEVPIIYDISETQIVQDSVVLTESICSEDDLKFGLAEASSISFDCFNYMGNITNAVIDVTLHCIGRNAGEQINIRYGRFVVREAKHDAVTGITHVQAYGLNEHFELSDVQKLKNQLTIRKYYLDAAKFAHANVPMMSTELVTMGSEILFDSVDTMNTDTLTRTRAVFNVRIFKITSSLTNELLHIDHATTTREDRQVMLDRYKAFYHDHDDGSTNGMQNVDSMMRLCRPQVILSNGSKFDGAVLGYDDQFIHAYFGGIKASTASELNSHIIIPTSYYFVGKDGVQSQTYSLSDMPASRLYKATINGAWSSNGRFLQVKSVDDPIEIISAWIELKGAIGRYSRTDNMYHVQKLSTQSVHDYQPTEYATLDFGSLQAKRIAGCEFYWENTQDDTYGHQGLPASDIAINYDLTENAFIKNVLDEETAQNYFSEFVNNFTNVPQYYPGELVAAGRPDIEAGDIVTINGRDMLVMRRTLTGEQLLMDDIVSSATELVPPRKYGYFYLDLSGLDSYYSVLA